MIRIRDPIHGSIRLSVDEMAVVDHPVFQRLRGIKQLGFADQAFPGATHTRYAHAIGAMEVGTRMFAAIFPIEKSALPWPERARLRQLLRLTVLLHDLGHAPASHSSESVMPARRLLDLPFDLGSDPDLQATHEDYTVKLLLDSCLAGLLESRFAAGGIEPADVVQLLTGYLPDRAQRLVVEGVDYYPVLHQIVSGEMDADRMDYLQRDSFFAGVSYGKFDMSWLLENLAHRVVDDRAMMALSHRAVFAFEDFLLSRYHMFVSVYYHHIAVGLDSMLLRYHEEAPDEFCLPTDGDAYAAVDDVTLWSTLRRSKNRWAQWIARREAFRRVLELGWTPSIPALDGIEQALGDAGVEHFICRDQGTLSKYYGQDARRLPIYVFDRAVGREAPIEEYARIYERYAQPTQLVRVYVRPDQTREARRIINAMMPPE